LAAAGAVPAFGKDTAPIRTVEVFPVNYPVTAYFKFLPKPERPAVFVKVTCEDGAAGWGQSVPLPTWSYETLESATAVLRNYLGPALTGRNPADIEGAHRILNKTIASSFSTGMPIAKAGLDLALHDLAGKAAGKSVAALWGRKTRKRGY
jgi:L-alanine-DL-glutamate epimerase-like enolase superfamily enzyme